MMRRTTRPLLVSEQARLERHCSPRVWERLLDALLPEVRSVQPGPQEFTQDVQHGYAEVLQVECSAFAVGDEWNDEGPIYIVQAEERTLLWLCGQWLYDPFIVSDSVTAALETESGVPVWPRVFTLERAPCSGMPFKLYTDSHETIRACKFVSHEHLYYFGESRLLAGTLETIEADLRENYLRLTRQNDAPQGQRPS